MKGPSFHRLCSLLIVIAPLALASLAPAAASDEAAWRRSCAAPTDALLERAGLDAATRNALNAARAECQQALEALQERYRTRRAALLDDEQREALAQARQELREAEAREARLNALYDEWQLSDEQREAMRQLRESLYLDMEALRKRQFDSRDEQQRAWQALRETHETALTELLDDDQIQALSEAMRGPGRRDD